MDFQVVRECEIATVAIGAQVTWHQHETKMINRPHSSQKSKRPSFVICCAPSSTISAMASSRESFNFVRIALSGQVLRLLALGLFVWFCVSLCRHRLKFRRLMRKHGIVR